MNLKLFLIAKFRTIYCVLFGPDLKFIAKKEFAEGMISEKQFSRQNDCCKELIKEASLCLRDEPIGTMEKVLHDKNYLSTNRII